MTQHLHPLKFKNSANLKELILTILNKHQTVLTLDEVLIRVKAMNFPHSIDKKILRRLVNKLVKQGLVEYVYMDLSYGLRLIKLEPQKFSLSDPVA